MKTKAWIALVSVTVVLIAISMIVLIVFMPQSKALLESDAEEYETVSRYDYTAVIDKDRTANKESHNVTESIVKEGIIDDTYVPGNSNPFTPNKDLTIYNEPGLVRDTTNTSGFGSNNTGTSGTKVISGIQTK